MADLMYAVTGAMDMVTVQSITTKTSVNMFNGSYYVNGDDANSDTTPVFGKIIRDIILPIICACGILGIILTVVVLSRKHMSTSTNCYLMGLAFADLFFLITFATRLGESLFPSRNGNSFYLFLTYATFAAIFMNIFLLMSIWITVMLAIERYIAICQPFMAAKMCTVVKARIIIVIIFVACLLVRLPNFFEHKVVVLNIANKTLIYPVPSEMAQDYRYYGVYPWIVDVVIMSLIPFVLLLVLNVCLIWEVRKSTAYIQQNLMVVHGPNNQNAVHKEEMQITFMLISVIIVFFICQAPYVIYAAIASINAFQNTQHGVHVFRYVAMLLITLKSAVNFILYCWFSEKFWNTLKRIFCVEQCLIQYLNKNGNGTNGTNYFNLKRFSSAGNTRVTFLTEHD